MSRFNSLKEMIEKAPMFQVESVWLKLTFSAILASTLTSGISAPSIIAVWFVFIVLCCTQKFVGLGASIHWFSKYVAALLGPLFFPQIAVHLFRRELIIALAILSYFYPNFLAVDAVILVSSFCGLALIEAFWPKIFSFVVMALMIAVPALSVYAVLKSDLNSWRIGGIIFVNIVFFMLGRILLWRQKVRWQPKAPIKDAPFPESHRIAD